MSINSVASIVLVLVWSVMGKNDCDSNTFTFTAVGQSTQFRLRNDCNEQLKIKMEILDELDSNGQSTGNTETGFASTKGWEAEQTGTEDYQRNAFQADSLKKTGASLSLTTLFAVNSLDQYPDVTGATVNGTMDANTLKFGVIIDNYLASDSGNKVKLCIGLSSNQKGIESGEEGEEVNVGAFSIKNEEGFKCGDNDVGADKLDISSAESSSSGSRRRLFEEEYGSSVCYTFDCDEKITYDPLVYFRSSACSWTTQIVFVAIVCSFLFV